MTEPRVTDSSSPDRRIALALSGGGFRATLFHLGVIRYLQAAGKLKSVRHIASVSGGSILAAHVAANWSSYTGSAKDFEQISDKLLKFTMRNVRGRIVRRLPWLMLRRLLPLQRFLPLPRSTTDLLIRELEVFYGGVNLANILALNSEAPKLSLVATNLTHPGITTFENERVRVVSYLIAGKEPKEWKGTAVPLHLAVACSAAYPAFFPPLAVSHSDVLASKDYGRQYHSDGGVIDNQGLQTLLEDKESDLLIISDASSSTIDSQPEARFGILTTGLRSMELMMAQIRRGHYASVSGDTGRKPIVINIEPEEVDLKRNYRGAVANQLPHVRTDLDDFDAIERQELIYHGYVSAREALGWPTDPAFADPQPSKELPAEAARHLDARSKFRLGLISWRDYVGVINLVAFLVILIFVGSKVPRIIKMGADLVAVQKASEIRSKPLGIIPHRGEIPMKHVDPVLIGDKQPKNPGFTVTADDRVWDLRKLALSDTEATVVGPALMTRYTDLVRDDPKKAQYAYRFETSGTLHAWEGFGDQRLRFQVLAPTPGSPPTSVNGSSTLYAYKAIVDCSGVPVGEPFTIIIQAQYNDAFLKRGNWWAGMIVSDRMQRASMRIVFPANLPFQNPSFRRYPSNTRLESETFEGTAFNAGRQPELLWTISPPESDNTYRVNWDWYPQTESAQRRSGWRWLAALFGGKAAAPGKGL